MCVCKGEGERGREVRQCVCGGWENKKVCRHGAGVQAGGEGKEVRQRAGRGRREGGEEEVRGERREKR